jgi:hypothetical protein
VSKFKAVATRSLPQDLLAYLDSEDFARRLLIKVLGEQLHVPNPLSHPAAHYVQQLDPAIEVDGKQGIELTLSKISVRDGRNFGKALEAMKDLLIQAIKNFVPVGKSVQIFCVIATDAPVYNTSSTLFEMEEEMWIDGELDQS